MFKNKEGQSVPQVTFHVRQADEWVGLTSDEVFKGKKVAVFSLPGAFTPTCSSSHVPRFNQLWPQFKQQGIDEIICISVNDAYVMNEWKRDQKADNITFLPDGNGDFTEKMGLLVNKENNGYGKRSWRYSMLVDDGTISKMFIEPEQDGDPYGVSDADTMLAYLAPNEALPLDVAVMTRKGCPFCSRAKGLLRDYDIDFDELELNRDYTDQSLRAIAGASSVPQVFINGEKIGGSDELDYWLAHNVE